MIGGSAGGSAGSLTFHHSPGGCEMCCMQRGASGIGGGTGGKMGSCGGGKATGTSSGGGRGSAGTGTGGRVAVVRSCWNYHLVILLTTRAASTSIQLLPFPKSPSLSSICYALSSFSYVCLVIA